MTNFIREWNDAFEQGRAAWRSGKSLSLHNPYWPHEEGYAFWRKGWLAEDDFTIITTEYAKYQAR